MMSEGHHHQNRNVADQGTAHNNDDSAAATVTQTTKASAAAVTAGAASEAALPFKGRKGDKGSATTYAKKKPRGFDAMVDATALRCTNEQVVHPAPAAVAPSLKKLRIEPTQDEDHHTHGDGREEEEAAATSRGAGAGTALPAAAALMEEPEAVAANHETTTQNEVTVGSEEETEMVEVLVPTFFTTACGRPICLRERRRIPAAAAEAQRKVATATHREFAAPPMQTTTVAANGGPLFHENDLRHHCRACSAAHRPTTTNATASHMDAHGQLQNEAEAVPTQMLLSNREWLHVQRRIHPRAFHRVVDLGGVLPLNGHEEAPPAPKHPLDDDDGGPMEPAALVRRVLVLNGHQDDDDDDGRHSDHGATQSRCRFSIPHSPPTSNDDDDKEGDASAQEVPVVVHRQLRPGDDGASPPPRYLPRTRSYVDMTSSFSGFTDAHGRMLHLHGCGCGAKNSNVGCLTPPARSPPSSPL